MDCNPTVAVVTGAGREIARRGLLTADTVAALDLRDGKGVPGGCGPLTRVGAPAPTAGVGERKRRAGA